MLVLSTNETYPIYFETFASHYCIKKMIQTYIELKELYHENLCVTLRFYN